MRFGDIPAIPLTCVGLGLCLIVICDPFFGVIRLLVLLSMATATAAASVVVTITYISL